MDVCKVNGLECCECQQVCESRKKEYIETDKSKFEKLLKSVGCEFYNGETSIEIHDKNILSYGGVGIDFDKNGKFRGFESFE